MVSLGILYQQLQVQIMERILSSEMSSELGGKLVLKESRRAYSRSGIALKSNKILEKEML